MPYPPLHMCVGLGAKAIKPSRFSFVMFGATQIAIDLQPLLNRIFPGLMERHTPSHTLIGATIIMFTCLAFRKPLGNLFNIMIEQRAAIYGAATGAYSHILLDAIVHKDVNASLFWPFNIDSHLYGLIGDKSMALSCCVSGILGALWLGRQGKFKGYIELFKR